MPGASLKGDDIYTFTKSCDGVVAAGTFLGHVAFVAVDTEDLVLVIGETGPGQRLGAGRANETVTVPRLVLVVHASRGYRLFAAEALLGELLVVAGTAENVSSFREEALRSYWPFTVEAGEAILMPRVAFVLHALCVRQYGFVTAVAAGSVLSGAALPTQDTVILGAKGLFGQRLVALGAAETLLVPVSALVGQLFCLHRDGPVALVAGVGTEFGVTAHTHGTAFISDKPLPSEVFSAVEAMSALCHLQRLAMQLQLKSHWECSPKSTDSNNTMSK